MFRSSSVVVEEGFSNVIEGLTRGTEKETGTKGKEENVGLPREILHLVWV